PATFALCGQRRRTPCRGRRQIAVPAESVVYFRNVYNSSIIVRVLWESRYICPSLILITPSIYLNFLLQTHHRVSADNVRTLGQSLQAVLHLTVLYPIDTNFLRVSLGELILH